MSLNRIRNGETTMSYDLRILAPPGETVARSRAQRLLDEFLERLDKIDYLATGDVEYDDGSGETRDAEGVNLVSIHVPYAFMAKLSVDHAILYEGAAGIAETLGWRAFDPQHDMDLDDPEFAEKRRRLLHSSLKVDCDVLELDGEVVDVWSRKGKPIFRLDMSSGALGMPTGDPPETPERGGEAEHGDRRAEYRDKQIVVTESGQTIAEFDRCGKVSKLEFVDDGDTVVSNAYRNKTVKVWNIDDEKLERNFSGYASHVADYRVRPDRVLITGESGLTIFDRESGDIVVVVRPVRDGIVAFTPDGDWEGPVREGEAIELDWIDNARSESRVFIPGLGFAKMERRTFKLNKLERVSRGHRPHLLSAIFDESG